MRNCPVVKSIFFSLSFILYSVLIHSQENDTPVWQQEVSSVLNAQMNAWNEGNVKGYMEGYWKSDSLLFTSGGKVQRGWQATFEKYTKSYDTKAKMGTLKFSGFEYYLLSSGSAWVFGKWELERSGDHPNGVFTLILKKFPDGWKIIHDHTSSSPVETK